MQRPRPMMTVLAVCICGTVWEVSQEVGSEVLPESPCCPGITLWPGPAVVEAFGG